MNNANEILTNAITLLSFYLSELSDVQDSPEQQFAYGEKTAYTECLEILLKWNEADKKGLAFNVEQRYPL